MAKFYKVELTQQEREELMGIIRKGKHTSHVYRNVYILLNADGDKHSEKVTNAEISKVLKVGMRTIDKIKKRFMKEGYDACLIRKPTTRVYVRKVDVDVEAKFVSIACSEPPAGFAKWSLRLLANKMIELQHVENISHKKVRTVLKNELKPWKVRGWLIPQEFTVRNKNR